MTSVARLGSLRSRKALAWGLAAAMIVLCPSDARADEKSDLEKGRNALLTRQYAEADARFRAMLDPATGTLKSPEIVDEARMCWGAALIALKRNEEAEALFSRILRQNPEYQPDPLTFSTSVLDSFTDTRARLKDEINAQKAREAREEQERKARERDEKRRQAERIARLEKLASEETVVEQHSRWVAALPFGVGQFQNGRPGLGALFAISEGALVVASAVTFGVFLGQRAQAAALFTDASAQYNVSTANAYNLYAERANALRTANLIIDGAFAALVVGGVVQAQLGYVPDVVSSRPRATPPIALRPSFEWHDRRGASIGIVGSF